MAIEEAVLEAVNSGLSPSTFRLWNNRTSVILGLTSHLESEVNVDACTRMGVPLLRRFTGGGTVYHDLGNLNWSFFLRQNSDEVWQAGIPETYRRLSTPIQRALRSLGVQASFRSPNAIFYGDLKLSGMAMYVKHNAVLCHGTLLVDADLDKLKLLLKQLRDPVQNINNLSGVRLGMDQVREAIRAAIRVRRRSLFNAECLDPAEEKTVAQSSPHRYEVTSSSPSDRTLQLGRNHSFA